MPTNFVTLQGNVRDFRENTTKNGNRVASFSVSFPNAGQNNGFSYVNVTAWNINDKISAKLTSGWNGQVLLVGSLKQEKWETDQGKRSQVKMVASEVSLLLPKPKKENDNPGAYAAPAQQPVAPQPVSQPVAPRPVAPQPQVNRVYAKPVQQPAAPVVDAPPFVEPEPPAFHDDDLPF